MRWHRLFKTTYFQNWKNIKTGTQYRNEMILQKSRVT